MLVCMLWKAVDRRNIATNKSRYGLFVCQQTTDMKQVINHLGKNWIKYGFETIAIVIGILGAHYLSNLQARINESETERQYLANLLLDLENQAATTEEQISFERRNRQACLDLVHVVNEAPFDVDSFNQVFFNLARKTYIVSNAVFEDLKHSGHISTIKDPELRYALFQFYQQTDYVEAVIANNNASYADKLTNDAQQMNVADYGVSRQLNLPGSQEISMEAIPFPHGKRIIEDQIQNDQTRFRLHNMLTFRAWINSVQERLLEDLLKDNRYLIAQLRNILGEEAGQ